MMISSGGVNRFTNIYLMSIHQNYWILNPFAICTTFKWFIFRLWFQLKVMRFLNIAVKKWHNSTFLLNVRLIMYWSTHALLAFKSMNYQLIISQFPVILLSQVKNDNQFYEDSLLIYVMTCFILFKSKRSFKLMRRNCPFYPQDLSL